MLTYAQLHQHLPVVICNKIEEKNVSMIKRGHKFSRFLSPVHGRESYFDCSIRHTASAKRRPKKCVFDQETRRKRENLSCSVLWRESSNGTHKYLYDLHRWKSITLMESNSFPFFPRLLNALRNLQIRFYSSGFWCRDRTAAAASASAETNYLYV